MSGINTAAIFTLQEQDMEAVALELFHYQYRENDIYRAYTDALRRKPSAIRSISQIPFLPIQFFKTHTVTCGTFEPELIFESSGTTQTVNSRHFVKEAALYQQSFLAGFERSYGPVSDYVVVGLLPSYLERQHSSLVYMVQDMVGRSGHAASGFYLYEHDKLAAQLRELEASKQKTLLIGVTFGLLDFAEHYSLQLEHTIVMETGGMKGRREEWTRQQVHTYLKERLGCKHIHAEYGMTELLSQAYSYGDGVFTTPPWMKILVRDENDPFQLSAANASGVINVVDLANVYSCAFIATDDIGKLRADGSFEVLGRLDNSALRGCSLMVS
jgi:hypothetical protein